MAIAIVHTESVQSMLSPLCTDVLGWVERAGLGANAVLLQHGQDANVRVSSKPNSAVPGRSLPSAWNIQKAKTETRLPYSFL